jgi:hypothetical protein
MPDLDSKTDSMITEPSTWNLTLDVGKQTILAMDCGTRTRK